jgi:hypothetical protein
MYISTILDLGTRWRIVVSFTPRGKDPWYSLDRPQIRYGYCEEEKYLLPPRRTACSPSLYRPSYFGSLAKGRTTGLNSQQRRRYFSPSVSRPAQEPIQAPMQWKAEALSPKARWPGRECAHVQLVPKIKSSGSISPFPHTSSWRGA